MKEPEIDPAVEAAGRCVEDSHQCYECEVENTIEDFLPHIQSAISKAKGGICDECSRKLEDGALYEDHTPRPLPFPARIGTLEEMDGDRLREQLAAAVDDWHSASQPPTPEDFEPTGNVECLEKFDKPQIDGRAHGAFTHWKTDSWQSEAAPFCTHWRKITPPKP